METGSTIITATGVAGASWVVFSAMAMDSLSWQPASNRAALRAIKTIIKKVILAFI
jgi:hypothetical protein